MASLTMFCWSCAFPNWLHTAGSLHLHDNSIYYFTLSPTFYVKNFITLNVLRSEFLVRRRVKRMRSQLTREGSCSFSISMVTVIIQKPTLVKHDAALHIMRKCLPFCKLVSSVEVLDIFNKHLDRWRVDLRQKNIIWIELMPVFLTRIRRRRFGSHAWIHSFLSSKRTSFIPYQ